MVKHCDKKLGKTLVEQKFGYILTWWKIGQILVKHSLTIGQFYKLVKFKVKLLAKIDVKVGKNLL